MKKIIFSLVALSFFSACESDDYSSKRRSTKLSHRIKPSESMQVGMAKSHKNYYDDVYYKSDDISYNDKLASQSGDETYQGYFKIGNPYEVFGVSYFPQNYDDYEEVGTASWYGDDFHGKPTANGEIYDSNTMTAAHRTLPLPSMVRITNLHNGKIAIVRVNDRGPFAKNRIIDVSEKAANVLGFRDTGTTDVKVELLRNETDEMLARLKIKN